MKYVTSKETGKRFCLHCRSYKCICLPESDGYLNLEYCTALEVKEIIHVSNKADLLKFYKQKLPNGKLIKTGSELMVPIHRYQSIGSSARHTILLSNDIVNKSFVN